MNISSVLNDDSSAEAAALLHVASLFQRPSQLDKLDMLRKRADRKKVF